MRPFSLSFFEAKVTSKRIASRILAFHGTDNII